MNYFQNLFTGRLNRINFWIGLLFMGLVFPLVLSLLLELELFSFPVIEWVPFAYLILMLLSIIARRFHDIGKSGWYLFLLLIPVVNFVVPIWLVSTKGTLGENIYGEQDMGHNIKKVLIG